MKKAYLISRILLGLIYVIFGLNGFYTFIPVPSAPEAQAFMQALIGTGYMLYFWKSIEVVSGILFLINRYTLLAALIVLPVTANILAFHLFLDLSGLPVGIAVFVMNILILAYHRDRLKILAQA